MDIDLKQFGEWLYQERERQELKQAQLERISGVAHPMISGYENGADIRISTVCKLLDALGYETTITVRRKENEN